MRTKELPRKIVYLAMTDLVYPDGGESRVLYRLHRDFPWVFEEGWQIERWGLRRRNASTSGSGLSLVRGLTFPFPVFPRVLLPVVVWATHFVQSALRPRAGILVAYSPVIGTGAAAARLLRRRSSVLVIRIISDFSARSRDLYHRRREYRILQALERFVLRRADLVLPMSSFTHQIATEAGVPEERIVELPNPTRWFGTEVMQREPGDAVRIVYGGRLAPEKGVDLLVAAFAGIEEEFPDLLLDVAGDGSERASLQQLARSLGIADRVRFRGWLPGNAMPSFLSGALIAVLPSRINEGLPGALVEAGIAGCALIGTDVGGIRDIVHPDRTGILVPPNDPEALADALRTLLGDPKRAKRLGEGARAKARGYIGRRDEAIQRVRERLNALREGRRDASEG
jgi:glycosyltransferase involved in cell wall biosynthesis